MYDLDTIKRLNRNPSKRNDRDKPALQPTREESREYYYATHAAVLLWRYGTQSPAMDREVLE